MTPLILVAGFLGAGKTTLLRKLIPKLTAAGCRPHIILNDYRNANVDALTLREYEALVSPISGTCVCCGSRDELMATLYDAERGPDSIVLLEANGTADTVELIELLSADERAGAYTLPTQVTVVDTNRWGRRSWSRLEELQVATAGYVQLAHREAVTAGRLAHVQAAVQALNPRARIVEPDALGDVFTTLMRDAANLPARRFAARESGAHTTHRHDKHGHAAHHFSSLELTLPKTVDRTAFETFLRELDTSVVRAKGIVSLSGVTHPYYFERLDRSESIALREIRATLTFEPVAILIGVDIDPEPVEAGLQRLRASA